MADETTLTTMNDAVPAASVADTIREWPYAHDIVDALIDIVPVPAGTGSTYIVPRFNPWTVPSGTKTETSAFSRAALSSDGVSITSGVVGGEVRFSRELQHDAKGGIPRSAIAQAMAAMRARLLADALALVTGCGASFADLPASSFGLDHIIGALRIADDMSMKGPLGVVLSPRQLQSLRTELVADGMLLAASGTASTLFAGHAGFVGEVLGIGVFCSPLVVGDVEGQHALLFQASPGSRAITCAEWDPIHAEALPRPDNYSDDYYLMHRRGLALTFGSEASPGANCVEIITTNS